MKAFSRVRAIALLAWCFGHGVDVAGGEIFSVPLNRTNDWQFLSFAKIPANRFRTTTAGFEIAVTNSAAPAVFPLAKPLLVSELKVSGVIAGQFKAPAAQQGEKGFDDYAVRIGLVESGSRRLGEWEGLFAPDWVKKLFALAPPGAGISNIHFFNVGADERQLGRTRIHPVSDLVRETVVAIPDSEGRFAFTNRFSRPLNVVAVWVSCDGDDTRSSFAVTLNKMELTVRQAPP